MKIPLNSHKCLKMPNTKKIFNLAKDKDNTVSGNEQEIMDKVEEMYVS